MNLLKSLFLYKSMWITRFVLLYNFSVGDLVKLVLYVAVLADGIGLKFMNLRTAFELYGYPVAS